MARMVANSFSQQVAGTGLRQIEEAILGLFDLHPDGLRNFQIADLLALRSDFRGRQKDYLTYSVLGGLLAREEVTWDRETKKFAKVNTGLPLQGRAQDGLQRIEQGILTLLHDNPQGLRNSEVADLLSLHSNFRGSQKDYLTYSVLGGLLAQGKVSWDHETKTFSTPRGSTEAV